MQTVTDATFDQAIHVPLAIVEFWNERCHNCTRFKSVYEDVDAQMGDKITMITANTDENQAKAGQFRITGVPTMIFFANGKEVHRTAGAMSKEEFLGEISRGLSVSEVGPVASGTPASGAPSDGSLSEILVGGAVLAGVIYGLVQLT